MALKYFRDPDHLKWESKGPQDWVSQADREVEKRIREYLLDLFPQDGFLGEESGKYQMDAPGIWVVDPIDGTSCFRRGMPEWCVSIAYVLSDRRIPLGVIYQPCTDELFSADPETGMRINGTQMEAAKIETFQDGVVGIGYSWKADPEKTLGVLQAIIDKQGNFESMGSGALMVAYVASLFLRILHAGASKGLPIGDSQKLLRNSVSLSSLGYLLEQANELQKSV